MKNILLIYAFIFATFYKGQTSLTYGQVYNFDVGDIVQGLHIASYNFGPVNGAYETRKILAKTVSVNNDSIIYTIQKNMYTPPSCQTCLDLQVPAPLHK